MAEAGYVGIGGGMRKLTGCYLGVNGAVHEVKEVYAGVNGAARLIWSSGIGTTMELIGRTKTASGSWEYALYQTKDFKSFKKMRVMPSYTYKIVADNGYVYWCQKTGDGKGVEVHRMAFGDTTDTIVNSRIINSGGNLSVSSIPYYNYHEKLFHYSADRKEYNENFIETAYLYGGVIGSSIPTNGPLYQHNCGSAGMNIVINPQYAYAVIGCGFYYTFDVTGFSSDGSSTTHYYVGRPVGSQLTSTNPDTYEDWYIDLPEIVTFNNHLIWHSKAGNLYASTSAGAFDKQTKVAFPDGIPTGNVSLRVFEPYLLAIAHHQGTAYFLSSTDGITYTRMGSIPYTGYSLQYAGYDGELYYYRSGEAIFSTNDFRSFKVIPYTLPADFYIESTCCYVE